MLRDRIAAFTRCHRTFQGVRVGEGPGRIIQRYYGVVYGRHMALVYMGFLLLAGTLTPNPKP